MLQISIFSYIINYYRIDMFLCTEILRHRRPPANANDKKNVLLLIDVQVH